MASRRRPHPTTVQRLTRTAAYATLVEGSKDRYTTQARKGRLHSTKSIPSDLTPPDNQ